MKKEHADNKDIVAFLDKQIEMCEVMIDECEYKKEERDNNKKA